MASTQYDPRSSEPQVSGWAVGGTNLAMPDDVGFELPAKGTKLNAQWHFYNSTGPDQGDQSSVQPSVSSSHSRRARWSSVRRTQSSW